MSHRATPNQLTTPLRLASQSSMVPSLRVGEFRYRTSVSAQCCFLQTYDTWLRITDFSVAEYTPSTSSVGGKKRGEESDNLIKVHTVQLSTAKQIKL